MIESYTDGSILFSWAPFSQLERSSTSWKGGLVLRRQESEIVHRVGPNQYVTRIVVYVPDDGLQPIYGGWKAGKWDAI